MRKLLILSILLVGACSRGGEEVKTETQTEVYAQWHEDKSDMNKQLQGRQFETTKNGIKITLNFDKDQQMLAGRVVNTYRAPYEITENKITIGMAISTMMMPIGDAAKVESEYLKFIGDKQAKTISLDKDILIISNEFGKSYKFNSVKK